MAFRRGGMAFGGDGFGCRCSVTFRPWGGMALSRSSLAPLWSFNGVSDNPAPPKELPPDEDITRSVKTDPNGVATVSLPEPGWWCLCVEGDVAMREVDGKAIKVRQRGLFWVHVGGQAVRSSAPSISGRAGRACGAS